MVPQGNPQSRNGSDETAHRMPAGSGSNSLVAAVRAACVLHEGGWHLTGDPFGELTAVHLDGRRSPPNLPQVVEDSG